MSKRPYDELNKEEEIQTVDPLFGQHRLFQVPKISENRLQELLQQQEQDLSKISTVEEYLNIVRYQLESSADFEYVARGESKKTGVVTDVGPTGNEIMPTLGNNDNGDDGLVLSQWQNDVLQDYDGLRFKYLELSMRYELTPLVELPSSIANWKLLIVNNKPNLSILCKLDLSQKFKLISLYQRWCSKKIEDNFIKWIFVMMLIIPELISYNELSILRSFGKKLKKLLQVVDDESTLICYKWCLTIISEIYGQKDLLQLDNVMDR